MTKITMRCATCGGGQVMRDAWAVWDGASQSWVLGAVFDAGFCDSCGGEVTIDEVEIAAGPDPIQAAASVDRAIVKE